MQHPRLHGQARGRRSNHASPGFWRNHSPQPRPRILCRLAKDNERSSIDDRVVVSAAELYGSKAKTLELSVAGAVDVFWDTSRCSAEHTASLPACVRASWRVRLADLWLLDGKGVHIACVLGMSTTLWVLQMRCFVACSQGPIAPCNTQHSAGLTPAAVSTAGSALRTCQASSQQ